MEPAVFGEIIDGQEYKDREAVYGLLHDDKGRLGIIKTPRGYFLPGGGVENDESHEECVIREFVEETGLSIDVGDYVGCGILYGLTPRTKRYLRMIGHFYKVKMTGEQGLKVEDDHELVWHDVNEAKEMMKLENQAWAIGVLLG